MYVSIKHGFVALNNPKCASTSVRRMLKPYVDIQSGKKSGLSHHLSYKKASQVLASRGHQLSEFYTFTTVRNPWDRLVSVYHYGVTTEKSVWNRLTTESRDFNHFIDLIRRDGRPFPPTIRHFATNEDRQVMAEVFKVEELQELPLRLNERFGIEVSLNHVNKSSRDNYRSYYNDTARKRVEKLYEFDITNFKYAF